MASSPILRFRPADALVILCILLLAGGVPGAVPPQCRRGTGHRGGLAERRPDPTGPRHVPGDLRDLRHVHQHRHRRLWQSGRHPIPDCPTQDCVHTGWISYTGQTIVCLPNGVEVRLTGGGAEPEIDGVSR